MTGVPLFRVVKSPYSGKGLRKGALLAAVDTGFSTVYFDLVSPLRTTRWAFHVDEIKPVNEDAHELLAITREARP